MIYPRNGKIDTSTRFSSNGLVYGHAYSLLRVEEILLGKSKRAHEIKKVKLVKLRNPWAGTEWTGAWGDGTPEWDQVSHDEKKRIGYKNKNDGGFWMTFEVHSTLNLN